MLPTQLPFLLSSTNSSELTGEWEGSFDLRRPDGSLDRNRAVLFLKQDGQRVIGSIGQSEAQQSPFNDGSIQQNVITFSIEFQSKSPMYFRIHHEENHLVGFASSDKEGHNILAKLDLQRISARVSSPPSPKTKLYDEIAKMDRFLFDAFNRKDLKTLRKVFAKDMEFYHDKNGLSGYTRNMHMFEQNFSAPKTIRRELVAGSLEVYLIKDYGAIQIGVHRFYSTNSGQNETLIATVKFVHIWHKLGKTWNITRVVSYDH